MRRYRVRPTTTVILSPGTPIFGSTVNPNEEDTYPVKTIAGLLCLGFFLITPAMAEDMDMKSMDHMNTGGQMKMDMGTSADAAPSSKAFEAAMQKMHQGMMVGYTGNADVDFVKGMIPHHQGAVDMAKIELQYGKDPELRKLAGDIIKAQETEIAFMKTWLAKNAK
jgi:uncharacterized protein (DUF305 family)